MKQTVESHSNHLICTGNLGSLEFSAEVESPSLHGSEAHRELAPHCLHGAI